jgi:hypothetical protein
LHTIVGFDLGTNALVRVIAVASSVSFTWGSGAVQAPVLLVCSGSDIDDHCTCMGVRSLLTPYLVGSDSVGGLAPLDLSVAA